MPEPITTEELGDLFDDSGLIQQELAERMGVSGQPRISSWLHGAVITPPHAILFKIICQLGIHQVDLSLLGL